MAGKLGVHECEGVAWKVYKVEFEPDWESHCFMLVKLRGKGR